MPVYLWSAGIEGGKGNAIEQRVRTVIPELVTISSIDDVLSRRADHSIGPTYVIVATPSKDPHALARLTEIAGRYRDRVFLILLSGDISGNDYKSITPAGGADWVYA